MRDLDCAYVYVLEEYTGPRKKGYVLHVMHIAYVFHIHSIILLFFSISAWVNLNDCQSTIVYERREQTFRYPPYWAVFLLFQWGDRHDTL